MDGRALTDRRVTIFAGHYGSGKTNIAVNFAIKRAKDRETAIADLDVVNPYFRTKDAAWVLKEHGIRLVASAYAGSNVDTPALPAEAYALTSDRRLCAVFDVGGDDRGALALGRYRDAIMAENDYAFLFVINRYRPLTRTAEDTVGVMREIEEAAGMSFDGVVNNSNLGDETTVETVRSSLKYADEVCGITGLPLVMTCVREDLLRGADTADIPAPFAMKVYVRQA